MLIAPDTEFVIQCAVLVNTMNYNSRDYRYLIYGGIFDVEFKPYKDQVADSWYLLTDQIHERSNKWTKMGTMWVLPLPLDGKQVVSLLEVRNCIPADIVFIGYRVDVCYSVRFESNK